MARELFPEPWSFLNDLPLTKTQRGMVICIINGKSTMKDFTDTLGIEETTAARVLMEVRKMLRIKGVQIDLISRYQLRVVRKKDQE